MRAAASHVLKIADGDDANVLLDRRRLAQGHLRERIRVRECASDGHVALYLFVYVVLQGAQFPGAYAHAAPGQVGVDAGNLRAQMQADDMAAKLPPDGVGQHVLARVLLHMVKAARPINFAMHRLPHRQGRVHAVRHVAVFHKYIQYVRPAQRARVIRLAAGGGIKGGLVEMDEIAAAIRHAIHHPRVKRRQIGVIVIQALCHMGSLSCFHLNASGGNYQAPDGENFTGRENPICKHFVNKQKHLLTFFDFRYTITMSKDKDSQ